MQTRVGSRYDVSVDRGHDRGLDPRFYWGERQKLGARTFLAGTRRVIERGTELDSGDVPRKGVQNMTITTVGAGERLTPLRRLRIDPLGWWRRRPGCW
jgi:hypothetical protein